MKTIKQWLGLFCLSFSLTLNAQSIDKMIVFGDSLSDNGNLSSLLKGTVAQPPYYYGRFSNGLIWAEILNAYLQLSPSQFENYAIAGAQTYGIKPPGLKAQVDKYLKHHTVNPNALYIIWSGGDNYIYHPQANIRMIDRTIDDLNDAVTKLAKQGAKTFLIPNLPDIGKTPLAQKWSEKYPKLKTAQHLTWLSKMHNRKLNDDLPRLANRLNINIIPLDIYDTMNLAIKQPQKFGLSNVTARCYTGAIQGTNDNVCDNPDEYFFWDWIHPTTKIHHLLAKTAYRVLSKNNIHGA